jgi:hypothetical protein
MIPPTQPSLVRGAPMRLIVQIWKKPCGLGHLKVLKLQCGHTVEHMLGRSYAVGHRTRCPECR